MSARSPKDKSNRDPDWQWLARMRRAVASFFAKKPKRSPECSDAESKPLPVGEQIYVKFQLERLDRYGFHQQPRRYRNIDPLDQLLAPARKEANDEEVRKPDEPDEKD